MPQEERRTNMKRRCSSHLSRTILMPARSGKGRSTRSASAFIKSTRKLGRSCKTLKITCHSCASRDRKNQPASVSCFACNKRRRNANCSCNGKTDSSRTCTSCRSTNTSWRPRTGSRKSASELLSAAELPTCSGCSNLLRTRCLHR